MFEKNGVTRDFGVNRVNLPKIYPIDSILHPQIGWFLSFYSGNLRIWKLSEGPKRALKLSEKRPFALLQEAIALQKPF